MNRSSFALFVALLIHLLFILLFWILGLITPEIQKEKITTEKKIKISLRELPKKHKESGLKKELVKPSPIAPPMPKGSQLKEIVKYKPKKSSKKTKLNPKPKPKIIKQKSIPQPKIELKKEPINPLYKLLSQDKSNENRIKKTKTSNSKLGAGGTTREMKKLYGSEWGKLTTGQQEYLLDNTEIMRRITQEVLNRQARVSNINNINVNRSNVIEFYLHPNGDMSDFKFLSKSGYYLLDDITKATIGYAYSKYPRPSEKTLIRYNVFYNLARY